MLLYIGASDDVYPLLRQCSSREYRKFIYIDVKPDSGDVRGQYHNKDLGTFIGDINERLVDTARGTQLQQVTKNHYRSRSIAEGTAADAVWELDYFINTRDVNMQCTDVLKDMLACVTGLYAQGYLPHETVYTALPNLRNVYVGDVLHDLLPQHRLAGVTTIAFEEMAFCKRRLRYVRNSDLDSYDESDESDSDL